MTTTSLLPPTDDALKLARHIFTDLSRVIPEEHIIEATARLIDEFAAAPHYQPAFIVSRRLEPEEQAAFERAFAASSPGRVVALEEGLSFTPLARPQVTADGKPARPGDTVWFEGMAEAGAQRDWITRPPDREDEPYPRGEVCSGKLVLGVPYYDDVIDVSRCYSTEAAAAASLLLQPGGAA